ncbi:MAG: SDR family oxidoreductase [Hyphomicrobiales bacterium]|nr:SDR family oxidoreductase [Hyphomicrobiales bacterium]MBV9054299.1 SDR family oxidoreductase [Hyphomicrobiales bacterium]
MNLVILGLGYSASVFARRMIAAGWHVQGTVRSLERATALRRDGIDASMFDARAGALEEAMPDLAQADALLVSIPPSGEGRDFPERLSGSFLQAANRLRWIGYLSTIGVYGDYGGAWIDETALCRPSSDRSRARLAAETSWQELGAKSNVPVVIFRLPGIYGPGRNALMALRQGTARRIVKAGQVFNRVHVEDVATALELSLKSDAASAVYNVTDDEPSAPQDVITFAAALLGIEPPPLIDFADAALSPMAASFYEESKRVCNGLIKRRLRFSPAFPSYREGLRDLRNKGEGTWGGAA